MRAAIEKQVEQTDVLADIDIKAIAKEAKIGWVKTLLIAALWPVLKGLLLKKLNARIVQIIEDVIGVI